MKMEYGLFNSAKKGFILTRTPELISDDLIISFTGAPNDATAIFENEAGNSAYRQLNDGMCALPVDFLVGNVKVVVATLNGKADAPKYKCESIYTKRVSEGVLICPNGIDIPMQIIELFGEIQKIKNEMVTSSRKHDDLNKKVDKLLDGYDFD